MKFKRTKPNHEPWKKRPVPASAPESPHPLDDALARLHATLAPLAPMLSDMQLSLELTCRMEGHRFRDDIFPDETVCTTCEFTAPTQTPTVTPLCK